MLLTPEIIPYTRGGMLKYTNNIIPEFTPVNDL